MKDNFKYVDVENLQELEPIEKGKRYLEFLGGTKKYRCFIVDKDMPRCDFYREHLNLLEEHLHPIYKNRGMLVAQDNTFPLPGFYIISFEQQYNSIDDLPEELIIRTSCLIKELRRGMRKKLGIKYINIYYEEKNAKSNNVHIWLMPKTDNVTATKKLYELGMQEYLESFDFKQNIDTIKKYNADLQNYFKEINYKKIDDELYNKHALHEKKINLCISKYCFIKCTGCYNNFCDLPEISFEKVSTFLEYAKNKGLKRVTISGGDPLAREDISEIIKKCFDLGLKVNLDTVGLPLIEDRKIIGPNKTIKQFTDYDLLKKVSMIGIPLDGSNCESVSKFRKSKDNLFEKTLKIFELFDKLGIQICVNTICHKENYDDIKNIYNVIKKYKCIKKWQVFQYMPIGPLGKLHEKKYAISKEIFSLLKKDMEKYSSKKLAVEFKMAEERSYNYMLVNSSGEAYKVDLNNNKEAYGNISDKETWENIMNNLC